MSFFLVTRRLLVNFAVRFLLILGSLGAFLIYVFGAFKKKCVSFYCQLENIILFLGKTENR